MRARNMFFSVSVIMAMCFVQIPGLHSQQASGPFGLHRGMTQAEVLSIVGNNSVKEGKPNALGGTMILISTVPKPYREFEEYQLFFSKIEGLLKIIAIGKDVTTSEEGTEFREHYSEMKSLLTNTYSTPKESDFVKSDNEAMAEPGNFMLSLLEHERNLFCFWSTDDGLKLKDDINGIVLEVHAEPLDTGYVDLTYEFVGWGAYVDKLKAAEAGVL